MRHIFFISIIATTTLGGCHAQTVNKQIKETSLKIISSIEKEDEIGFKKLIGVDLAQIGKNQELLHFDFEKMKLFYRQYIKGRRPEIIITEQYDELGKLKVIVPFYRDFDSTSNTKLVQLELYYGPPNFVSLNKISNYKIVVDRKVRSFTSSPEKNN